MPRYTRRDEYAVLREQLAELGARLGAWAPGARSAVFVDANHHVDREAAARAGIAVYGKNTMAITRRHGSWVVLGVLVTDAELEPTHAAPEEPAWDACGSCRACIDACPTGAIVADGVLDARRCLSYHTQSRMDELPSPAELGRSRLRLRHLPGRVPVEHGRRPPGRGARAGRGRRRVPAARRVARGRSRTSSPQRYRRLYVPDRDGRRLARNARAALANLSGTATGLIRRSSCSADRRTCVRTAAGSITSAWPR